MPGSGGGWQARWQETAVHELYGHRKPPFALPFLKVAEAEQVLQANRLLLFCLKLFLIMTHLNKFMMIEHPSRSARAEDAWLASIWKLFATQVYKYHPFVWQTEVMQGYFGSKSPKPTTLLFTSGPVDDVASSLDAARTTPLPCALEMGKNADGEYNTASLKSYPGDLCKTLASYAQSWIFRYVQNVQRSGPEVPMDEFLAFSCKLLQRFNTAAVRGADYFRGV